MQTPTAPAKPFPQPLDRVSIAVILLLAILIGALILSGDRSAPRVRAFNWQGKQIGADDSAFVFTFSRPMNHLSVEQNLKIDPPLPGKFSWSGRRMAYTLTTPAPYGTTFQVKLENAQDRFTGSSRASIQPFRGQFQSRDRAFAYIGVEGDDAGRLILFNLSKQEKKVLTPANLLVMDFKPYPDSDRILFAATDRAQQAQSLVEQKLYTVTTGISIQSPAELGTPSANLPFLPESPAPDPQPAGQINLVLDNAEYQNLKFDLSADGNVIVVQRVNRKNTNDFGPWILRKDAPAQPLDSKQPGGEFLITPDSASLAITQGQGLALLPLQPQADPLDFLPKFGTVLDFSKDGSSAAMVKFNNDYTRSLYLISNQGTQKEIFKTTGSILSAQFDPTKQILYCLLTNLVPGANYQEQPYLAAIDLKAAVAATDPLKALYPLVLLPKQRDIQISLAPDGLALLFDQTDTNAQRSDGKEIANSRLWLLPLTGDLTVKAQPESLPLPGFHPRWLL
ncbi:hypothetical protein ACKFKG_16965 [Phormidesmis sp. 146-35]